MFYYLDKVKIQKGVVCVLRKSVSRIPNIDTVFGAGVAIEYIADSLPPFLIYDTGTNSVRVPTQEEKDKMTFKRLYAGMDLFGGFWTTDNLNPGDFIKREGDTMDGTLAFNHSIPFTIPYNKPPQIWLSDGTKAPLIHSNGLDVRWSNGAVRTNMFDGNLVIGGESTFNNVITAGHGILDKIKLMGTSGNAMIFRGTDGKWLRFGTSSKYPGGFFIEREGSGVLWSLTSDGHMTCLNQTSTSDARLKKNVKPINNALDLVKKLHGVRYQWRKDGHHDIGLIAQDVQKVIPEVVKESGGYLSIDYARLVSVLIEAIHELSTK